MWEQKTFGKLSSDKECKLYSWEAKSGLKISVTDYGISLVAIKIPDTEKGITRDVLLGFDNVQDYENHDFYSGCIVGRVASRIEKGQFDLDGESFQLTLNNNNKTHLHGGFVGLSKVVWDSKINGNTLEFRHVQADGTDGYPGNLEVVVRMNMIKKSSGDYLSIDMHATCDKATPINLTFHPYFNMDGHDNGNALGNKLTVFAYAGYVEMNPETVLPTGKILPCRDTAFKFEGSVIKDKICDVLGGFDHTFSLCYKDGYIVPGAEISSSNEKMKIKVMTSQPGLHVYSGNFLNGTKGKEGAIYNKYAGIALEAQNFPNAVNISDFPNCILRPGENYDRNITFRFIF